MKAKKDLILMKSVTNNIFENDYEYFFADLVNTYISKSIGIEIIKVKMKEWDKDAKEYILSELVGRLSVSGIMEADFSELINL